MCLGVRVGLVIGIVLVDRVKCFLERQFYSYC